MFIEARNGLSHCVACNSCTHNYHMYMYYTQPVRLYELHDNNCVHVQWTLLIMYNVCPSITHNGTLLPPPLFFSLFEPKCSC